MAPERTAAIEHLAESYGKVASSLADVGEYLDHVAKYVRRGTVALLAAALILGIGMGYGAWNGYQGSKARAKLLTQTEQIRRTSGEVHSAVTPGQPIYEAGQKNAAGLVTAVAAELDCRTRRALAHLPVPDPAVPCVAQTPASVLGR